MVRFKTFAAVAAAMGLGSAASAAVVSINHTFYNGSFSTRRFTMTVTAPGVGIGAGSSIVWMKVGGMTITLSDLNGNGAVLTSSGASPIYRATVNSAMVHQLAPAPFRFEVLDPFGSQSTAPLNYNEVLQPGVDPTGTLGLDLTFELSAGDSASVNATFEIVPAPATAALLGLAGIATGSRRRRD